MSRPGVDDEQALGEPPGALGMLLVLAAVLLPSCVVVAVAWLPDRLRALRRAVAWWLAGDELAELNRWRVHWHEARQWLAEFPESADALEYLLGAAKGGRRGGLCISSLRETMRDRRIDLLLTQFEGGLALGKGSSGHACKGACQRAHGQAFELPAALLDRLEGGDGA